MLCEELVVPVGAVGPGAGKASDDEPPFWSVWGTGTLSQGNRGQERDKIQFVFEKNDVGGWSGRMAQGQDGRPLWQDRGSEGEGGVGGWGDSVQTVSLQGLCQEKGLRGEERWR